MCVPKPEHTLRTLSTNRRGEGEAPPPAPSTYTPRRTRPAHARLTPGPYASDGAGGGGGKSGGREVAAAAVAAAGCGSGGGGRGGDGTAAHAPRPAEGGVAPPLRTHAPPRLPRAPPPPGGALTRPRSGWAARGASGFLGSQPPPTCAIESSRVLLRSSPPPTSPGGGAGHGRTGVSLSAGPGVRAVRRREAGELPRSPTRTALRVPAGSAATRVGRGSGACRELEFSTAAGSLTSTGPQPFRA